MALAVKNQPTNVGDAKEMRVRSLGWEDSPGKGNGNLLQYSHLGNSMDRGTWWATVHRVANSKTHIYNMFTNKLGYIFFSIN